VGDLYSSAECNLGEETFHISIHKPNEPAEIYPHVYQVLRVIPERLIVAFQPIPKEASSTGGVSPGFHVFLLSEHVGKTVVTCIMEHASRTQDLSEEEALALCREDSQVAMRFWRDVFIPTLKKLVYDSSAL
jgi:hypothetical protein